MQIGYIFLAILPILGVLLYFFYKLVIVKILESFGVQGKSKDGDDKTITVEDLADEIDEIAEKAMSKAEEVKIIIFDSIYKTYSIFVGILKTVYHQAMHYFVILLKIFRDFTDWVYIKSRDRFVETAAKERKSVKRFWKHLKEYKKESDKEE